MVSLRMSSTLSSSVRACRMFVTGILLCSDNMQGLCYNLYGRLICVGLRLLLQIMLLTPREVEHLISPRWLEEM